MLLVRHTEDIEQYRGNPGILPVVNYPINKVQRSVVFEIKQEKEIIMVQFVSLGGKALVRSIDRNPGIGIHGKKEKNNFFGF